MFKAVSVEKTLLCCRFQKAIDCVGNCFPFCLLYLSQDMRKYVLYANNKGADQPAHPRSLISAFIVRCLDSDSVMSLVSVTKISSLLLLFVAEQASLSLTWSETPEDTFSHDEAHLYWKNYRTSLSSGRT